MAGCTLYLIALCVLLLLRILTCCRRLMPAAHLQLFALFFSASAYAAILCPVRAYVAYDYCRLNHTFSHPGEWLVIDKLQAPVAVLIMATACGHQLMTANCSDQADAEEPLRRAIKCPVRRTSGSCISPFAAAKVIQFRFANTLQSHVLGLSKLPAAVNP